MNDLNLKCPICNYDLIECPIANIDYVAKDVNFIKFDCCNKTPPNYEKENDIISHDIKIILNKSTLEIVKLNLFFNEISETNYIYGFGVFDGFDYESYHDNVWYNGYQQSNYLLKFFDIDQ